ncbi:MAG: sigma 54-interacting transcriptional regulator [Eubacteriales bacterium]|nr:sigma 54-interacting transcriptional regulator [Eubacteriales bacterium]
MDYNHQPQDPLVLDPAMVQNYAKARILSKNQASVLICGESGTGKNHLAEYIHQNGSRSGHAPVSVHCNAIPSELFASELFGYFPNAFTGASSKGKTGLLEMANHSTIIFDEINELSLQNQTLLLHFLQNKSITPIGSLNPKQIDARIICISGRSLRQMVDEGSFRLDLYYRICVAKLYLPPMRKRQEEIPLFIRNFIKKYAEIYHCGSHEPEIDEKTMNALKELQWMGNIREIDNFAQKICLSEDPAGAVSDYIALWKDFALPQRETAALSSPGEPGEAARRRPPGEPDILPLKEAVRNFERQYIQSAVRQTGSLPAAAQALGISLSSLYRKRT